MAELPYRDAPVKDAANYATDAEIFRGSVADYSPEREQNTTAAAIAAVDDVQAETASIELFFDATSPTCRAASELLGKMRELKNALPDQSDYSKALIGVIDSRDAFVMAFLTDIER